ncbi:MAG: YhcB family protein [Immundisolibacteraceae bacterium]|nr:YhcB family protein [Immundisolibacteraceae bacterium]
MLLLLTCVVLGIGFGLLLHKLFGKTGNQHALAKENQQLKSEFERYRGQVNDHFSTSAELFERVSDDYRRLLGHMADGTNNLDIELPERLLADFKVAPTPIKALAEESDQPAQSSDETAETSIKPGNETISIVESNHAVSESANDSSAETAASIDEQEPDTKPT